MNAIACRLLGAMLFVVALAAFAHGDEPVVSQDEATARAGRAIDLLVEQQRLAPSWRGRKLKLVETTQAPMGPVWIISFENSEEANQAKRVIYIYLDDHGEYIGANHTGKR